MVYRSLVLGLIMGLPSLVMSQSSLSEYSRVTRMMGSRFEIIAVAYDSLTAMQAINRGFDEISRLEQLISSWLPQSQTSKINDMAGQAPVNISEELYDLIYRSLKVSILTEGAFDISFAGLAPLWKFDGQEVHGFPDSARVAQVAQIANYKNVILNSEQKTVFLSEPGMKIGFGSIGKGYAANQAMSVMKALGIKSGMVNAGGDLITWGKNKNSQPWSMGVADPNAKNQMFAWLSLQDMALVTSGNYEKYFVYNNERYGHILDPRTGYPAKGLKSVSILCPDAELADALATAVYVMGEQQGMKLINQLKGIECLIITEDDRVLQSKNLALKYYAIQD